MPFKIFNVHSFQVTLENITKNKSEKCVRNVYLMKNRGNENLKVYNFSFFFIRQNIGTPTRGPLVVRGAVSLFVVLRCIYSE